MRSREQGHRSQWGCRLVVLAAGAVSVTWATVDARYPEFVPPDDPTLLSLVYANFNIGTAEEVRLSFTTNTPGEDIEVCMVEQGFDYGARDELEGDPRWTMSPEEYAATYGFGIVAQETGAYPSPPDPNAEYVTSLSAGQRDAYFRAEDACRLGPDAEERVRYFNAFAVAFEAFSGEVYLDDRAAEALESWQSCLADAGYQFESPQQMRESFYLRLGSADLDELQLEEITMASANVPCESAYKESHRDVVADGFDEFKELLAAAIESGAEPDAQG